MSEIQTIVNWIGNNPQADLNVVLGGGGLSLVLEKLLTKYNVNSKKLAFTLLHVIALVTAGLTTWLANLKGLAPAGLYASLVIVAGFWHRFMISGIYTKGVEPTLSTLGSQLNSSVEATTGITVPPVSGDAKPFTLEGK